MTPKERVLAALRHEEADRVPIGEFAIDHELTEAVLGRPTFYRAHFKTTKALWEGRRDEVVDSMKRDLVELTLALDLDMVPVQLVPSRNAEHRPMELIAPDTYRDADGSVWRYSTSSHWLLCVEPADAHREFTENDFAYAEPAPPDPSEMELIDYVTERLGKTHFLYARSGDGSFALPGGMERGLMLMIERPDLVRLALETATRRAIATDRIFIDAGVDALMPSADYATTRGPMMSPMLFEALIFPVMKRHCEAAHTAGMPIFKHACGNNRALIRYLVDAGYDAYQSIQQSASMDLAWLKREFGRQITLWGGVPTEILMHGTPDDTRAAVRHAISDASAGGGFILGSSHSAAVGTVYENYRAMLDEARRVGDYSRA
jgi:uroporphyrinogen decarboxylase